MPATIAVRLAALESGQSGAMLLHRTDDLSSALEGARIPKVTTCCDPADRIARVSRSAPLPVNPGLNN